MISLSEAGTDDTPVLVRLWNEEQDLSFDVIVKGAAGEERLALIPAADSDPAITTRLFNADQGLWFDLLCKGAAGEEILALSDVGSM